MVSKWQWIINRIKTLLWLRAAVFCMFGMATALGGLLFRGYIPDDITYKIGAQAVDGILNILATSMLAATTFSLSVMVAAYAAAANSATPRATKLLLADNTAQNALSTFIGAFLFSMVGIITLKTGIYGDNGRLILFVATIVVIAFIIITLLRWIEYLSRLGRVGQTIDMVEKAADHAIRDFCDHPFLGCKPAKKDASVKSKKALSHPDIGYIQHIDVSELENIAQKNELTIHVNKRAGTLNDSAIALAYVPNATDEKVCQKIRNCFTIRGDRSFEQDPRYGLIVLSEIASRALSPAVNDPGTAIDVIGTQMRLLARMAQDPDKDEQEILRPHVIMPPVDIGDFFDDSFKPIARDGSGMVEVVIRLQKALISLASLNDGRLKPHAARQSAYLLKHAAENLKLSEDREAVKAITL